MLISLKVSLPNRVSIIQRRPLSRPALAINLIRLSPAGEMTLGDKSKRGINVELTIWYLIANSRTRYDQ